MNKFIKEQLNKCVIKLPEWNDDTTELIISFKNNTKVVDLYGNLFNIKIENYIINEPANFTLSSNWNGGTKPPEHEMKITIVEKRGKMYKVSGEGTTTNIHWEGWLPEKGFSVI